MKSKKALALTLVVLTLFIVVGVSVYAASNYGTQSDPLVTLSYLTDKLSPTLLDKFDDELETAVKDLEGQIKEGDGITTTYKLLTLQIGDTLNGSVGCELLLRNGAIEVASGSLVNMTSADSLESGSELTKNNLCMFSEKGSVTATSAVTLLVRGDYTVN